MTRHHVAGTAAVALLSLALTACGSSSADDDPTLGAPSATRSAAPSTAPGECPLTAQPIPPPKGVSTDLKTKPTVAPSSAAPPKQVQVADVVVGTGAEAKAGSQVRVKYVGALYDTGKEFDSSWSRGADETLPFGACMQGVIPGFAVAPIGMKVGGRREVVIPSEYGYGAQGQGPIPGGATLVFVIDLVDVTGP